MDVRPIDEDYARGRLISAGRAIKGTADSKRFTKLIGILVDRIDAAPTLDYAPKQQWISVKDRLPETTFESNTTKYTDSVLAFDDCEDVCIGHFCISKYDGNFIFYGFTDGAEECDPLIVTHWMPMPEPPKEEISHDD